jgi:hypothetical protein
MLAALTTDAAAAIEVARSCSGTAYSANVDNDKPHFAALVTVDDRQSLEPIADVGLYTVEIRVLRHQRRFWPAGEASPGLVAVFSLVRPADKSHDEHVTHLRDVHAPLALRHHPGLWHYYQVSVQERLSGLDFDGFALLGFASEQEYAERFFGGDDDIAVIMEDAPKFVDQSAMPSTVRTTEWRFTPD